MLSLFGGLAAASVGGLGIAQAATAVPAAASDELAPELKAGLDKADAEFSQTVVRRTTVVRPAYRRPVVVRRTTVVRPAYRRPVVVRRTTVVRRPVAYRRPVVVRRRVIYR
ncbi:hypothetical protein ASE66_13955 [Bosea sp. Root483D1]|uniref:hypothetical protein n=1 Tax=Bosea sp. Root483D1 TaxID=1736544 RepID=UPI00070CCB7E|nr:hypothetical protein [Bosea sp. Root483D1]KRE14472.1 hypothetical protein ASE66_13955 [Bosea sp. Root483D1]